MKTRLEQIAEKYKRGLKGINDGISALVIGFLRTVFSVVKWIAIVAAFIIVFALVASVMQSCNLNHPE